MGSKKRSNEQEDSAATKRMRIDSDVSIEQLKVLVKKAKKAYKATNDKSLKKEYKALKKQLAERENAPEEVVEEESKPEAVETIPQPTITSDYVKLLKAEWKEDKDNEEKKAKYEKAKEQLKLQKQQASGSVAEPKATFQATDAGAEEADDDGKDTLFIANFSWDVNDEILVEKLKEYVSPDEIAQIRWGTDRETGQFKGWGHVQFTSSAAAKRAFALNKQTLQGRELRVDLDKSKKRANNGQKQQGDNKDKYKLKPADKPAANPQEADRCFVGNLSFKITEEALIKSMSQVGAKVVHVFWVTDKQSGDFYGSSFLTFDTPNDAAMAVASNGMYIMGRPARVEYAPHKDPTRPKSEKKTGPPPREPSERPEGGTYTAFFGNLSFEIDDDVMTKFCQDAGAEPKSIRWLTHSDTGSFKGAGFIDFKSVECVDNIIKMNGEELMGRPIRVDYA